MKQLESVKVRRFNIYSGKEINIGNLSICIDPAKIVPEVFKTLSPGIILISHESMDHMDPVQVYQLQKSTNCKIVCSIAAAVDLIQNYPLDYEFQDNINTLLPGTEYEYLGVVIKAEKSIHCDYMLPLIFKINFINYNINILDCIDTLLMPELGEISRDVDISMIPLGIAKGINEDVGCEFIKLINSKVFVTSHFKFGLERFVDLIKTNDTEKKNNIKVFPIDWDEECTILSEDLLNSKKIVSNHEKSSFKNYTVNDIENTFDDLENINQKLLLLIEEFNYRRHSLMTKSLISKLLNIYEAVDKTNKSVILLFNTLVSLYNPSLVNETILELVRRGLLIPTEPARDDFKATLLFFNSIYCQQRSCASNLDEIFNNSDKNQENVTYWVVQALGRISTCKCKEASKALEMLMKVISVKEIFESVVVRRQIFWEFYRLMKYDPSIGKVFANLYNAGLEDFNPDVRLLAVMCIGVLYKTNIDNDYTLLTNMVKLYKDDEDDVREGLARVLGSIARSNHNEVLKHKSKLEKLLDDSNCHVRRVAKLSLNEFKRL